MGRRRRATPVTTLTPSSRNLFEICLHGVSYDVTPHAYFRVVGLSKAVLYILNSHKSYMVSDIDFPKARDI